MLLSQQAVAEEPAVGCSLGSGGAAPPASRGVRCREIRPDDAGRIAALLHRGFPRIPAAVFRDMLARATEMPRLPDVPHVGLVLLHEGTPVGVLLTIASNAESGDSPHFRCNLACWHVDPVFRIYAPLLVLRLGNKSHVTYINISPARETLDIIAAQGFRQYSLGAFAGVPALSRWRGAVKVRPASRVPAHTVSLSAHEWSVLRDHDAHGSISLICSDASGDWPLVFRRRIVAGFPLPCAQLVYSRDLAALGGHAGPVGRFLAVRGMFWILVAGSACIAGIPGKLFPAKLPMYYRGGTPPRHGDLAYTEAALYGF